MKTLLDRLPRLPAPLDEFSTPALVGITAGGALALSALYAVSTKKTIEANATEATGLPDTSFFLGDLPAYLRNEDRIHDWMAENTLRNDGKPWMLQIPGMKRMVVIATPDAWEEISTTQFDNFPRGEFQISYLEALFGHSIVNSDGKRWYHQRKASAKFFTAKSLRACMMTSMHKNVHQMYDVIDKAIAANGAANLTKLFHAFTLQTFTEVGLGLDLQWIGNTGTNPMDPAMEIASVAMLRRFRTPPFFWKTLRLLNVGSERRLADSVNSMRSWIRSVITDSLHVSTDKPKGGETIKSVVELFLEQSNDNTEGMGPDDLVDYIFTFVVAASDTSSLSLAWFFLTLAKRPDIEAKLRAEMAAVLPAMGVTADTYLTTDHVQKLVYLEAMIKEVLRVYPSIPLTQKEVANDTVICGNLFLRKGDLIGLSPYAMGRNTHVWGPDAAEFKPERWIDPETGDLIQVSAHKLPAFNSGPRMCIGMKLAMLELRIVTANLLHRYHFDLATPNDGGYIPMIGLNLKTPVIVNATRLG